MTTEADLKPCPCGKIPKNICIYGDAVQSKYAFAMGDCCNEWLIEFRNNYATDPEDIMLNAVFGWNATPRGNS